MYTNIHPSRSLTLDGLAELVFHHYGLVLLHDEPTGAKEHTCLQTLELFVTSLESHLDDCTSELQYMY